ncbi:hypothetical protein [Neobacillus sp. YIM B06451]|uniref:hypothetical protein n=1 Tax=Neobacillus sp. YIM B06451 TaxID=3070994 RepID=UPI00292E5A90|nr:hypothetical protein [Neobacillus sp. YIM B06451]
MRKITILIVACFLIAMADTPKTEAAEAGNFCDQFKNVKTVWWNGMELKPGQIGRLNVVKDTPLFKVSGEKIVFSRTLKKGEFYRIYAFKPGMLSVGGGYFVDRDTRVKYETPSKSKLQAVKCISVWNTKTPYPLESYVAKDVWINMNKSKSSSLSENDFYNSLYPFVLEISKLKNPIEKEYLIHELYRLRTQNKIAINKIIVKLSDGEKYLFSDNSMLIGDNLKFENEIYLKTQYLNELFGLLSNQFTIKKETLPGGLKGRISAFYVNSFPEKVYLDMNDINSDYYEKIVLRAPWTDKTLEYGGFIDKAQSFTNKRNPYSINDLFNFVNITGSYSLNGDVLEIHLPEVAPK